MLDTLLDKFFFFTFVLLSSLRILGVDGIDDDEDGMYSLDEYTVASIFVEYTVTSLVLGILYRKLSTYYRSNLILSRFCCFKIDDESGSGNIYDFKKFGASDALNQLGLQILVESLT